MFFVSCIGYLSRNPREVSLDIMAWKNIDTIIEGKLYLGK